MSGDHDILVIDTDNRVSNCVRQRIQSAGYNVHTITGENQGLLYIRHRKPDVILLSQKNPANGLMGLVRQVRAVTLKPIILLIKPDEICNAVPLLELGATDYSLLVPGGEDLLLHVLGKHISYSGIDRRVNRAQSVAETLEEKLKLLVLDQQAGFRVQRRMMPSSPSTIGEVHLNHQIFPSLILSGDFIDYFPLSGNQVLFYLADVSGHGASSAFVTVLLRSLSRRLQGEFVSLNLTCTGDILKWMNKELLLCELEHHVTMFLGVFDMSSGQLEYSNAAHFPAAILSTSEDTVYLKGGGRPLGLFKQVDYESRSVALSDCFTMILFSDGVFEIMSQTTLKDKEDHLLSLVQCGTKNVDSLAEQLGMTEAGNLPDDIAVFTMSTG